MYSIVTVTKFDSVTFSKEKIIKYAFNDLINNLKKHKIKSEILIGYYGKRKDLYFKNLIVNTNNEYVKTKIRFFSEKDLSLFKIKKKNEPNFIFSCLLNNLIEESQYKNIIIKAQDTIFNKKIFLFLRQKIRNKKHFYNTYRYDSKISYNSKNQNFYIDYLKRKKFFKKNKFLDNNRYYFFMNLHTNACGDFILFNKFFFRNVKFPQRVAYTDLFFIYNLYFNTGQQRILTHGKVYKIISKSSHIKRVKTLKLSPFQVFFEQFINLFNINTKFINIIRGIFNYPKVIRNNEIFFSYERYVYLNILKKKILNNFFNINQ